jgi:sulfur carrier protein
MTVWLNGEERELPQPMTVAAAVAAVGVSPEGRGIAAAVDGEVVPRDRWNETALAEGQRVEVVQAVQGG